MAFLLFETIIYCRLKGNNYASKQYTYTHKNRGAPEDEKYPTTQKR